MTKRNKLLKNKLGNRQLHSAMALSFSRMLENMESIQIENHHSPKKQTKEKGSQITFKNCK